MSYTSVAVDFISLCMQACYSKKPVAVGVHVTAFPQYPVIYFSIEEKPAAKQK